MKRGSFNVFDRVKFSGKPSEFIREISQVEGWLSKHEAALFLLVDEVQKRDGVRGYLAELGVWRGRGAILLCLLRRPGEDVYAVDIFDLRDRAHSHYNDPELFKENIRKYAPGQEVKLVTVDTAATPEVLSRELPASGCRIFHVDGGHEYKSVRHDMAFAASTLTAGGVMVCDDVFARKFPGVTQALIETLMNNPRLAPFAISTKKAWLTTGDAAELYLDHFSARCVGGRFRRSEFMGREVLVIP